MTEPVIAPAAPNANLAPGATLVQSTPAGQVPAAAAPPGGPAEAQTPEAIAAAAALAETAAKAAPAPAPAAIGEDAPKGADPLDATQDGEVFAYDATGDAVMDFALDFVGKLGFGPNDPAMLAAGEGNFDLLEIKLAALGDKAAGHERIVALAKQALANAGEAATKEAEATKAQCAGAVGLDVEGLDAMIAWGTEQFKAGVMTPQERDGLNRMLAAGGVEAIAATKMLYGAYSQASGLVQKPSSTGLPANGGATASAEPLTRVELAKQTAAIVRKYGSASYQQSPEYKALAARALSQR